MTINWDVLCIGRAGVDIYPLQLSVPLDEVSQFGKFLGGSAANVSVAVARLGHRCALISKTGGDPFGHYVRRELERNEVDTRFVSSDSSRLTPVTFCEIFPPNHFPLYFYRLPDSPDLCIEILDVPYDVATASIFWSTLTGLSCEPSREAHMAAYQMREHTDENQWCILDLDYRSPFWSDGEKEARQQAHRALPYCDIAVGNMNECRIATGQSSPHYAARALLEFGVKLAIVKQGPDGVLAMTNDETWEIPAYRVEVVNGLGSGDAFGGALCHGLLNGWPMEEVFRFANAAGAHIATKIECSSAMPTEAEIRALQESNG